MTQFSRTVVLAIAMLMAPCTAAAQFDPGHPEPLAPLEGTVFLGGGGDVPEETWSRFVQMAGGEQAKLVVLSTRAGSTVPAGLSGASLVKVKSAADARAAADALGQATGVWLLADTAAQFRDLCRGAAIETRLHWLLHRGGVLGGNGEVVAVLANAQLDGSEPGLDLVPGVVLDVGFDPDKHRQRLVDRVAKTPHLVGIGVEAGTVAVLHRRWFDVFGEGSAHAVVAKNDHLPVRVERIRRDVSPRSQRRGRRGGGPRGRRGPARPEARYRPRRLEDLVALSRDAMARTRPRFPALQPPKPDVPRGALMIVGGGGSPPGFMDKFMELAGGKDALLLYIPCTESQRVNAERTLARWRKAGASNVDFIHTKDRHEADTSAEIHDKLKRAGGLFFGGGRQWNLVDSWQHTEAHRLMHEVLQRGGVIAGSSAGASIQGSYMIRGNSLGNLDPMAPGYDTGLGFLTGVGIDQHFSQRGRQPDMTSFIARYPQMLGIGLDEASSIIVQGSIATCFSREGRGVHFYDAKRPADGEGRDYQLLQSGQRYDLARRVVLDQ